MKQQDEVTFKDILHGIQHGLFTAPKPIEKPSAKDEKIIAQLEQQGKIIYMKKDDGHGHTTLIGSSSSGIGFYTLGELKNVANKHPALVSAVLSLKFPAKTVLSTEISCLVNGKQDHNLITSINRPDDDAKSAAFIAANKLVPKLSIFNTLMWSGEDTRNWSNADRYNCIVDHLKGKKVGLAFATEILKMSVADARAHAKAHRWEGGVIYNADATTEFGLATFGEERPSIPRPDGMWKDVEKATVDFVAYDYIASDAPSHKGAVKDFYIGLIDPHSGKIIPCGKCGTGMKRADRIKYADRKLLPVTVKVVFKEWSKYGKTSQGSILEVRDAADKHYSQCVATEEQLSFLSQERIALPA